MCKDWLLLALDSLLQIWFRFNFDREEFEGNVPVGSFNTLLVDWAVKEEKVIQAWNYWGMWLGAFEGMCLSVPVRLWNSSTRVETVGPTHTPPLPTCCVHLCCWPMVVWSQDSADTIHHWSSGCSGAGTEWELPRQVESCPEQPPWAWSHHHSYNHSSSWHHSAGLQTFCNNFAVISPLSDHQTNSDVISEDMKCSEWK